MSITFWVPEAPRSTQRSPCPFCEGSGVVAYVEGLDCGYCGGHGWAEEEVSELPEINMSNHNAYSFLMELGLEADCCGSIPVSAMDDLAVKLTLLSCGITSAFLEEEPRSEGIITYCGRDTQYVQARAKELLALVKQAKAKNYSVTWG